MAQGGGNGRKRGREEGEAVGAPERATRASLETYGFNPEDLAHLLTVAESKFGVTDEVLFLETLRALKSGDPWGAIASSSPLNVGETTFRRQISNFLEAKNWNLDPNIRYSIVSPSALNCCYVGDPNIRGCVDVVPVFTRQTKSLYNGKYKRACWKFEVWTTNGGIPFWCRGPFCGSLHDQTILGSDEHPTFRHAPSEGFLADKAYTHSHLIVPRKEYTSKPYTEDEKNFLRHHRKSRAVVEHFFARLKRFSSVNFTKRGKAFVSAAMKFLVWCFQTVMTRELNQSPTR
jgi:hypothetical protein